MAFKIVYGAGQTLSRSSESKFGSGYGFLAMHREESVRSLAFEVLEKRLTGNSYDFEYGDEWIPEGSDTKEPISISSFLHCQGWYVLTRLRPIPESRGRMYFLAEFLLVDENEALKLALGSNEEGRPQVSPADILASQSEELWFSGKMWEQRGTWYSDPIDLVRIFSDEREVTQVRDTSEWYTQHKGVFNHKECVWNCDRALPANEPFHVLKAMAAMQRRFFDTYRERLAEDRFSPGNRGFFDLAWNQITFTNFYLNPSTGLDIHFGEKESELPYTWTAAWQRVPSQSELLKLPNQIALGTVSDFDEERLIEHGFIKPAPVTPAPTTETATGNEKPIALDRDGVGAGKVHERKGGGVSIDNPFFNFFWRWKYAILGVFLLFSVTGYVADRFRERSAVKEVIATLNKERESDKLGAGELDRELAKIDQKHWDRGNVEPYVKASKQAKMLKKHFDLVSNTPAPSKADVDFTVDPNSSDPNFLNRLNRVWKVAVDYQGLLKKAPENREENLKRTRELFSQWVEEEDEISTSFRKLWDLSTWTDYQKAINQRFEQRLALLIQAEEDKKKNGSEVTEADRTFRKDLHDFVNRNGDKEGSVFASLRTRATNLNRDLVAEAPSNKMPGGEAETSPKSEPETAAESRPKAEGPIASAILVRADADKFFPYPQGDGVVLLVPQAQSSLRLEDAVWMGGEMRVPIPTLEGIEKFSKLRKGSSNVKADGEEIGEVHTNDPTRFKFLDEGGVSAFLVEGPPEKFEYVLFLRKNQASSIDIGKFLNAKEGMKITEGFDVPAASVSLQVEHPRIGSGALSLSSLGEALQSQEKLGLRIASDVKDPSAEKPTKKGEEGITKEDATAFQSWFWGEGEAGNSIEKTFLKDVSFWREEEKTRKEGNKEITYIDYPSTGISDKTTKVGAFFGDLESPKLYLSGSNGSYRFPAEKTVSGALTYYLRYLCERIAEDKEFFPNLNGAEFIPERIKNVTGGLETVSVELKALDSKGVFKPQPSDGKADKKEKLKSANRKALRTNWKIFLNDLPYIIAFAREADKGGPIQEENYVKRITDTLAKVPAGGAPAAKAAPKDEFKEKLESGDLSELKFRLIVK